MSNVIQRGLGNLQTLLIRGFGVSFLKKRGKQGFRKVSFISDRIQVIGKKNFKIEETHILVGKVLQVLPASKYTLICRTGYSITNTVVFVGKPKFVYINNLVLAGKAVFTIKNIIDLEGKKKYSVIDRKDIISKLKQKLDYTKEVAGTSKHYIESSKSVEGIKDFRYIFAMLEDVED
jgi:hypothetical protein